MGWVGLGWGCMKDPSGQGPNMNWEYWQLPVAKEDRKDSFHHKVQSIAFSLDVISFWRSKNQIPDTHGQPFGEFNQEKK